MHHVGATAEAVSEYELTHHPGLIIKNAVPSKRNGIFAALAGDVASPQTQIMALTFPFSNQKDFATCLESAQALRGSIVTRMGKNRVKRGFCAIRIERASAKRHPNLR
jgi:hypothetical protein